MRLTHLLDTVLGFSKSPGDSLANAIALAQKAIALNDSEGNPHSILGFLLTMKGEYEKGFAEGERAIELNPSSADAHARLAMTLNSSGRWGCRDGHASLLKNTYRSGIRPYFMFAQT